MTTSLPTHTPATDTRCDYCKENGFQAPNLCEDCRPPSTSNTRRTDGGLTMGITYGDHLIDSGYNDITPEQERAQERGCKCYFPGDCDGSCTHPEPIKCTMTFEYPVAFRVKDYADGWAFFLESEKAQAMSEAMGGALIEKLYTRASTTPPDALPASKEAEVVLRQVRGMLEVEYHDDGRIASVGHASDGLRKMVAVLDAALSTAIPAGDGVPAWRPMETAPTDGTVVNVVGRYHHATAGFPRYAAFNDGHWVEYSRYEPEHIVVWAWRPRDEWPREDWLSQNEGDRK